MNKKQIILTAVGSATLALALMGGAYMLGRSHTSEDMQNMQQELEQLQKNEMNATIIGRVSKQMEDIAYQQKAVSDEQRIRAEEQSALAQENARRAEKESQVARKAEANALKAFNEAKEQRLVAEREAKNAEYQLKESQLSMSISDTMNYRTMGRTIGQSALTTYENGNRDLAGLLAYTSWYFLNKYNGNTLMSESLKALQNTSHSTAQYTMPKMSAVKASCIMPGTEKCVMATGYGEVVVMSAKGDRLTPTTLFADNHYDFRDVYASSDGIVYALSFEGTLLCIKGKGSVTPVALGMQKCTRLIPHAKGTLLITAQDRYTFFDMAKQTCGTTKAVHHGTITAAMHHEGVTDLFFSDESCTRIDAAGKESKQSFGMDGVITCAHYDEVNGFYYLGRQDGIIRVKNKWDNFVDLIGHTSRITDIKTIGDVMMATAYDRQLHVWDISKLHYATGVSLYYKGVPPTTQKKSTERVTPTEWQVPTAYDYAGWPLTVSADPATKYVWVGVSNGIIHHLCVSPKKMKDTLKAGFKRNLTQKEWEQYVGVAVPYIELK